MPYIKPVIINKPEFRFLIDSDYDKHLDTMLRLMYTSFRYSIVEAKPPAGARENFLKK